MFFLFFPQQLKKINIWNWFNCPIVLLSHLPLATWVSSLIVIRTPGLISNYHIVIFDSNQYSNTCTPGLHSPGVQALVSRILEDKHGVLGLEGSGLGLEILALTTSLIVISVFPTHLLFLNHAFIIFVISNASSTLGQLVRSSSLVYPTWSPYQSVSS